MDAGHVAILTGSVAAVTTLVGCLVTALVTRRGQDANAAGEIRDDLMQWIGMLRQQIAELQARVDAGDARFQAREAQLIEWGMWATTAVPRRPPAFVWPPIASTSGGLV